jgi:CDP-diacylglycerol pyrophosphatase
MNSTPRPRSKQVGFASRLTAFRISAAGAAICACATFLLLGSHAAQSDFSRNALWEIVHNVCVPGQSEYHDPKPCLQVDLNGGPESGFAILRDPRGGAQFLLIPTTRIPGIESPIVRGPNAPNYFANAWGSRSLIDEAVHTQLPRDGVGLAINSAVGRSQDQLHIHFSCIRDDVWEALHKEERKIGNHWAPFQVSFFGHRYEAMWVSGEDLGAHNPFRLLAEGLPDAARDMADRTLVVIGWTRTGGTEGFVLLADEVNKLDHDLANGEELLDHSCRIIERENKSQGSAAERAPE